MNNDYEEFKTSDISFFNDNVLNEINNFRNYMRYVEENKIKLGNLNWIILDSSKYKSLKLIEELKKVASEFGKIPNAIFDYNFCYKEKLDENKMMTTFIEATSIFNVLVLSDFSEKVAIKKFGSNCTFFANLNDEISLESKKMQIRKILKENRFKMSEQAINKISTYETTDIERTLTRAFILTLNAQKTFVKEVYLFEKQKPFKNYFGELENMIGLENVKETIREIINYLEVCKNREELPCLNFAFMGNPGTGKTSIARIFGKILASTGILSYNCPFVEVSRNDLIGRFIGSSEMNTLDKINQAVGGVLFIDEAYALCSDENKQDFGYRIIDVLVKQLDIHKSDLCVIFAGYKEEMSNFLSSNTGLDSRVPFQIIFDDYSENELYTIFCQYLRKSNLRITVTCKKLILNHFKQAKKQRNFGNGRYVRNFVERLKIKQANRIINTHDNIQFITKKDIEETIKSFEHIENKRSFGDN